MSVALPVYNAQDFLEDCFNSILNQERTLSLTPSKEDSEESDGTLINKFEIEVSLYEDGSTDRSPNIIEKWLDILSETPGFSVCFSKNESGSPKGGKLFYGSVL